MEVSLAMVRKKSRGRKRREQSPVVVVLEGCADTSRPRELVRRRRVACAQECSPDVKCRAKDDKRRQASSSQHPYREVDLLITTEKGPSTGSWSWPRSRCTAKVGCPVRRHQVRPGPAIANGLEQRQPTYRRGVPIHPRVVHLTTLPWRPPTN